MINLSFTTGCFRNQLKITNICPIFKNGSKDVFPNYRPISVLPSFSKIFERAVPIRVFSYINLNDILTKSQFVFRPRHSTAMAVLDMYDKVSEAIDDHSYSIGIFEYMTYLKLLTLLITIFKMLNLNITVFVD